MKKRRIAIVMTLIMAMLFSMVFEGTSYAETRLARVKTQAYSEADGIHVEWEELTGAEGYRIYRRPEGEKDWKGLENITATSYLDSTAEKGIRYEYVVRGFKSVNGNNELGDWSNSDRSSAIWLEMPELVESSNNSTGIKIKWNEVTGATSYRIYRKIPGESYSYFDTVSGITYTDKTASDGQIYVYTVRAYAENARSDYSREGIKGAAMTSAVTKASSDADGIHLEWNEVSGVSGYRVYRRKAGVSNWTRLGDVTETSYIDNTAEKGTEYEYIARGYKLIDDDKFLGSFWSSDHSTAIWLETPVLSECTNAMDGLKVTWEAVSGATSYRIYRKIPGNSYDYLATTTSLSYIDKTVSKDQVYAYTVRAYAANARSGYSKSGIIGLYLERIKPTAVADADVIKVSWPEIEYADGYRVYRRVAGTSAWTRIGIVTETSMVDTAAESGVKYEYIARGYKSVDGEMILGAYRDSEKSTAIKLDTPKITSTYCEKNIKGTIIEWDAVKGATTYRIYRKIKGESFDYIGTVSGLQYVDASAKNGQEYLYTVRAYYGNNRSGYDHTGTAGMLLMNSPIEKISDYSSSNGYTLTIANVSGADGYKVYRREEGSGWKTLGFVTSTTYSDKTAKEGEYYEYVARAYKDVDGKRYLGYWLSSDVQSAGHRYVIVIDPGHDRIHSGATAVNGSNEMEQNLKISLACKAELETYSGVVVYLTHETLDCPYPDCENKYCLINRNKFAQSKGADYFISFHNNAGGGPNARGAEVYYPNANYRPEFNKLGYAMASNILDELSDLGLYYRGLYTRSDDEWEYSYPDGSMADYYSIIRNAKLNGYPGLIIEHAFVDAEADFYGFLSTDAKLAALGRADARGIAKTLGLKKK